MTKQKQDMENMMSPNDRATFRYTERDLLARSSEFFEGRMAQIKFDQKKLSKDVFRRFRRNRSSAYHRGKKKWVTLEVHESQSMREAREFYLHCKAVGK
jgi:hypothetical protein